jgi:hypothetical protein
MAEASKKGPDGLAVLAVLAEVILLDITNIVMSSFFFFKYVYMCNIEF